MSSHATFVNRAGRLMPENASLTDRAHLLFVRYHRDVDRLVRRLLGPDHEHDDIVQDVFVRVVSRASTLRDPARERAWVTTVAVSVVHNLLRKRKVRRIVEFRSEPPEQRHDLEPRLLRRDLARRGYQVLDQLDPKDRIVLLLRRVEDRAVDEVAEICNCSAATVKRRLVRADARLAELLRDCGALYEEIQTMGGDT